jgi:hypothetical protein
VLITEKRELALEIERLAPIEIGPSSIAKRGAFANSPTSKVIVFLGAEHRKALI